MSGTLACQPYPALRFQTGAKVGGPILVRFEPDRPMVEEDRAVEASGLIETRTTFSEKRQFSVGPDGIELLPQVLLRGNRALNDLGNLRGLNQHRGKLAQDFGFAEAQAMLALESDAAHDTNPLVGSRCVQCTFHSVQGTHS